MKKNLLALFLVAACATSVSVQAMVQIKKKNGSVESVSHLDAFTELSQRLNAIENQKKKEISKKDIASGAFFTAAAVSCAYKYSVFSTVAKTSSVYLTKAAALKVGGATISTLTSAYAAPILLGSLLVKTCYDTYASSQSTKNTEKQEENKTERNWVQYLQQIRFVKTSQLFAQNLKDNTFLPYNVAVAGLSRMHNLIAK